MEDFLADTRWLTRNEPGNPPTFSTRNEQSNVDITISSPSAWALFRSWKVRPDWTNSDHRVLDFTLGTDSPTPSLRTPRLYTKRTDWVVFMQTFEDLLRHEPEIP